MHTYVKGCGQGIPEAKVKATGKNGEGLVMAREGRAREEQGTKGLLDSRKKGFARLQEANMRFQGTEEFFPDF